MSGGRKIKRLYFDIETSPNIVLSWRIGWKINLSHDNIIQERAVICICYKWQGDDKVHRLQWNKGDDRKMIERFVKIANEADELVGHNVDRFDLKWFNTRVLLHSLDPIPEAKTVDTLVIAKKRFYLNSNKLDYLAHILLGEGKSPTNYGMWKDILLNNSRKQLKKMVDYCERDVRLLERVYDRLAAFHKPKTHAGVMAGLDRWTCPHCASTEVKQDKRRVTTAGITQYQMRCKKCLRYFTISAYVHRLYAEEMINRRTRK